MVVSAAKRSQRKRRAEEAKNRETQAQATVTKQNQDVINIDSSEEEFLDNNEHNEYDQNNINILRFVENNIADDDDEYDCDEGLLVERLWPVFYKKATEEADSCRYKRMNLAGNAIAYQKPQAILNSGKLKPARIPKQTAHSRKLKQKKEAGNNDIRFYLRQATPQIPPSKSETLPELIQPDNFKETPIERAILDNKLDESEKAHEAWVESCVDKYRSRPSRDMKSNISLSEIAQKQWMELDTALKIATEYYQSKQKKDPKFQFPIKELGEVREFNHRRQNLVISGARNPAVTASVLKAESSIQRDPAAKNVSVKPLSGLGRSRHIRLQANYLISHGRLAENGVGLQSPHPSMLDDVRV